MEQRLTIIGLGVNDLKQATHFYENVFGWQKTSASTDSISFFKVNGMLLSLYPREKLAEDAQVSATGSGFKAFTLAYNTRSQEEVDTLVAELTGKGAKLVKAAEHVFWGGYSAYIADVDDNLWEIAYNPFLRLDEAGGVCD